jgi:hypothetical protein
MKPERQQTISTRDVWQKGLDTLRATRRQTLIVAGFALVGPQLLLSFVFDWQSSETVAAVRKLTGEMATETVGFERLLEPVLAFTQPFALVVLMMTVLGLGGYFALIELAVTHHRGDGLPAPAAAIRRGLVLALKRGLGAALAVGLLTLMGQVFVAPAILVIVLSLVLPVVIVAEGQGLWRSLGDALMMRYVRGTSVSPWSVLLTLMSLAATLYVAIVLIGGMLDFILHADQWLGLSRDSWTRTVPGLPFGPVYIVASLLESLLLMGVISIYPALTTALYFSVAKRRKITSA